MSKSVKITVFILVLALTAIYFFSLIELYTIDNLYKHDSMLHHKLVPNVRLKVKCQDYKTILEFYRKDCAKELRLATNSLGFVGNEINFSKGAEIVMLGNSFTQAPRERPRFVDILSQEGLDIVDLSSGGYSPIIEFNVLKKYGIKLHPKIIWINFGMTDVYYDNKYEKEIAGEGSNYSFVYKNSRIYSKLSESKIYDFLKPFFVFYTSITSRTQPLDEYLEEKKLNTGNIEKDTLYAYTYKNETEFKEKFNVTLYYLGLISELAKRENAKVIIYTIPHSVQMYKGFECFRELQGLEQEKVYSKKIIEGLESFAIKNNMTHFIASVANDSYYYCDMHLNEKGHKIVAKDILEKIKLVK